MRERLIELLLADVECGKDGHADCSMCEYKSAEDECVKYLATLLADHLLANGVIVPPCKVGDWVYILRNGELHRNHICQMHIAQTYAQTFFSCYGEKFGVEQIGKTVFLTREEAEQALKGGE